jgi:hypothetical protein
MIELSSCMLLFDIRDISHWLLWFSTDSISTHSHKLSSFHAPYAHKSMLQVCLSDNWKSCACKNRSVYSGMKVSFLTLKHPCSTAPGLLEKDPGSQKVQPEAPALFHISNYWKLSLVENNLCWLTTQNLTLLTYGLLNQFKPRHVYAWKKEPKQNLKYIIPAETIVGTKTI